jgi:hypothetical protein
MTEMTENRQNGLPEPHTYAGPETFDTEISVRQPVMTMVWVFGISIVTAVVVWLMMLGFGKLETMTAKPMTPIQKAHRQEPPPEPRLERSPYANLDEMRAEENQLLEHPGWVDREQGVVRLSIEEAIGVLAERGLPDSAAPAPGVGPTGTTAPGVGTAIPPDVQPPPPPATAPSQPPVARPPGGHS